MKYEKGSFMWAVEQMKQGKKVRRKVDSGWYAPPYIRNNQNWDFVDVTAVDWGVFEVPKKTLSDKIETPYINNNCQILHLENIKEFIATIKKRIEDKIPFTYGHQAINIIDEETGEELDKMIDDVKICESFIGKTAYAEKLYKKLKTLEYQNKEIKSLIKKELLNK